MGEILLCSQRVYSDYERGVLDIPTEILIRLADFYDVSTDYILNRTDDQTAPKKRKA
ncbi:MAG: helix-turn-helix domain-containing protein [Candidatus Fimenecus sp.]